MSEIDNAEAVQEFEAKRGVSDPPEERASRSKDSGRRPSAGTSIGDADEAEDEDEYQTGPKPKVSLSMMINELCLCVVRLGFCTRFLGGSE